MSDRGRPNHLAGQTSPYLLQHLYNPVDWYAWGDTAIEKARREDKPIFLSIGYAACHWCHVMERESFEDPQTAALLNRDFVAIKVDREERPDIDAIYMNAVQLMTGQGGWPLSAFLTPALEPFMAGTYFPPEDRHGLPGFPSLLERIADLWRDRRQELDRAAASLTERLQEIAAGPQTGGVASPGRVEIVGAVAELTRRFDGRWGGFGGAPKFPPDGALDLLIREHVRSGERVPLAMAETTLQRMALGGMYDHVGGGFARYSVDERWLVPHFEKMLYNQALLVPAYVDAWLVTRKPLYRRVAENTLDFVRRELTDRGGGFYSSLDADSEGVEGKFYVWTPQEVVAVLGPEDGAMFNEVYDITERGNFEGKNNPNLLGGSLAEQAAGRGMAEDTLVEHVATLARRLLEARERRVRPAIDDKILSAWNGLMLGAFARAYQHFGRPADLAAARQAARFVLEQLLCDGRLLVSHRDGRSQLNAYVDDYAFLARGLLDLYEACFEPEYLEASVELARTLVTHFENRERGGFFFTSDDHESLLTRHTSLHDSALPAGAGVAAEVLLRLAVHVDARPLREAAERALIAAQPAITQMPSAHAALLRAADLAQDGIQEIAIVGAPDDADTRALLGVVRGRYRRSPAVQVGDADSGGALLCGKKAIGGRPTAYVCRDYACQAPTADPETLERLLSEDRTRAGYRNREA